MVHIRHTQLFRKLNGYKYGSARRTCTHRGRQYDEVGVRREQPRYVVIYHKRARRPRNTSADGNQSLPRIPLRHILAATGAYGWGVV
jgi:hypothetical protein